MQGQLQTLHADAGSKGQQIGELQREKMTFQSMVEESNRVVSQLKEVRKLLNFIKNFIAKNKLDIMEYADISGL